MYESFGMELGQHIPGETLHNCLHTYATQFNLDNPIQFHTNVLKAEKLQPEGRKLTLNESTRAGQTTTIACTKLVVATGLISNPLPLPFTFHIPKTTVSASDSTSIPILTFTSFPHHNPAIHINPDSQHVTVHGTGKAAHGLIYLLASHHKCIKWIIRPSGHGATYLLLPYL